MPRNKLIVVILFLLSTRISASEVDAQRGSATLSWLAITANTRDAGMGNTSTFSDKDASAAMQNPAGLGRLKGGSAYFNHTSWIADMAITDFAVSYPVPYMGTFALMVRSMNYGGFEFTRRADNPAGYVEISDDQVGTVGGMLFGAAWGAKLTDQLSFGFQARYARDQLGQTTVPSPGGDSLLVSDVLVDAFLYDAGTYFGTGWRSVALTMTVQNVGPRITASTGRHGFSAPMTLKVGITADLLQVIDVVDLPMYLRTRVEGVDPRDAPEHVRFGSELAYDVTPQISASIRGGYFDHREGGLTLGLGLTGDFGMGIAAFDYAYVDYGSALGSVNMFGIGVTF